MMNILKHFVVTASGIVTTFLGVASGVAISSGQVTPVILMMLVLSVLSLTATVRLATLS